jgi:hypothetical protein
MSLSHAVSRSNQLTQRSIGLWTIALALTAGALSTVLTGCRFGNHTSTSDGNSDGVSGFYNSAPERLQFCVSSPDEHCADAATTQVPSLIANEMTDPLRFLVADFNTGEAYIASATSNDSLIPVWLKSDRTNLFYIDQFTTVALWRNDRCVRRMYLDEEGSLAPGASLPVPGSSATTRGRVNLRITVTSRIEDNYSQGCAQTLQAMKSCYLDVTACGGGSADANATLQDAVRDVFEPYIQARVMTAADIPNVTRLTYEIQYQ